MEIEGHDEPGAIDARPSAGIDRVFSDEPAKEKEEPLAGVPAPRIGQEVLADCAAPLRGSTAFLAQALQCGNEGA